MAKITAEICVRFAKFTVKSEHQQLKQKMGQKPYSEHLTLFLFNTIYTSEEKYNMEQPTTCHPNCFILHLLSATTEDTSV